MQVITKNILRSFAFQSHFTFTNKNTLINATPAAYADNRTALKENGWRQADPTYQKSAETHLSNAEYLVHKIPVIYTDQSIVRCMGGTQPGTGHPQVYIQLNTRKAGQPVSCKWCSLRFALKPHHH